MQLLLEYCGGGAVDSIMMELSRHLTEQQIHYIMKEILKALDFLHGKNVIHRDLKAGNVLLTSDARVKLGKLSPCPFLLSLKLKIISVISIFPYLW